MGAALLGAEERVGMALGRIGGKHVTYQGAIEAAPSTGLFRGGPMPVQLIELGGVFQNQPLIDGGVGLHGQGPPQRLNRGQIVTQGSMT
jgi:hypothetical protein